MSDARNDPWHNRHPEWAQLEADQHRRADRRTMLRLQLGLTLFAFIAICATVVALRDHLPQGW